VRAVFVSDIHVSPREPEKAAALCDFLERLAREGCDRLYVLGDLFHVWVGPGNEDLPVFRDVIARLAALSARGCRVLIVHGNRDFHIGPEVARACGAEIAPEGTTEVLDGRRVRVAHGDLLCRKDTRYQAMRRVIRSRVARGGFLALPLAARLGVGRLMRGGSRLEVQRKAHRPKTFALAPGAVRRLFQGRVDAAVVGHVHHARRIALDAGGRRGALFTLGAWDDGNRSWLECRDGEFTLYDGPGGERVLAEG